MNISLTIKGDFLQKLDRMDSKKYIMEGLRDASTHVMQQSIRNAPAATGALRQSIRRELNEVKLSASIFPTRKYGFHVHGPGSEGRTRPHWIPKREAQQGGSLYRWAKKRGANPWAVRAAIAKRGTKFNPWLKRTAESEEEKAVQIMREALQNIVDFLSD